MFFLVLIAFIIVMHCVLNPFGTIGGILKGIGEMALNLGLVLLVWWLFTKFAQH